MGINFQMSTYQKYFLNESSQFRSVFLFLHQPPPPYVSAHILFLCPLPQSDGEGAAQDAQK